MKNYILFIILLGIVSCQRIHNIHKQEIKNQHFKGVILRVFQDPSNHMMYTFEIKTNKLIFEYDAEDLQNILWYAKTGDSIIKEKDSLYLTLKKGNKRSIYYYEEYLND